MPVRLKRRIFCHSRDGRELLPVYSSKPGIASMATTRTEQESRPSIHIGSMEIKKTSLRS